MNRTDKGVIAVACTAAVYLTLVLAFWVAVIWVAVHFISKFW